MKDGYYLSTYLEIDPLCHALNTSRRHDFNVSLWLKQGFEISLVHYWELERVTRIKHHSRAFYDTSAAMTFIATLLDQYHLKMEDIVEIWGTPGLDTCTDYHSLENYPEVAYHSVSHLFSGVLLDTELFYNDTILGLALDAGPDSVIDRHVSCKNWYAGCVVKRGAVDLFPVDSPGHLWNVAAYNFYLPEGSLMALASAFPSLQQGEIASKLFLRDQHAERFAYRVIKTLERKNRNIEEQTTEFNRRFSSKERTVSLVMSEVQSISLELLERCILQIINLHGIDPSLTYLSITGGYALNCPSNTHLMNKYGFKGLISPPCVNDGGQSLGIALYAFYKKTPNGALRFRFGGAYLGDEDRRLDEVITSAEFRPFINSVRTYEPTQAASDICQEPIIWFNGRAELGPRALGNRSILADPRHNTSRDQLNEIKLRQWWRPVAPVVTEELTREWFEETRPSPYMLEAFKVRSNKIDLVPAITHFDHSARLQTVNSKQNTLLHSLLDDFWKHTGIPMLCNTSLNDKGEPIINHIADALKFALIKSFSICYINGKRVELRGHEDYKVRQRVALFDNEAALLQKGEGSLLSILNPYSLELPILMAYAESTELRARFSLARQNDVDLLRRLAQNWRVIYGIPLTAPKPIA